MANDALYSKLLTTVQTFDHSQIQELKENEIRIILPCLVVYVFRSTLDDDSQRDRRQTILAKILQYQACNSIQFCLTSSNLHLVREEVEREMEIAKKVAHGETDSYIPYQSTELDFERSEGFHRCRLVLKELMRLIYNVRQLY